MKHFETRLRKAGHTVTYIEHAPGTFTLERLFEEIIQHTNEDLLVAEVLDFLLEKRLDRFCSQ